MYKYNSEDQKLVDKMVEMGLHISNKGFNYILEAVKIVHNSKDYPKMTGKDGIYGILAEKFSTTYSKIERDIRSEVERYYSNRVDIPKKLECDISSGKLSNSEFLARLAYILYSDEPCTQVEEY